jgi:hypothetical protein
MRIGFIRLPRRDDQQQKQTLIQVLQEYWLAVTFVG